ncbi:MAG TPA: aspartyl-phosphate phosphatase Spo0E family protein [Candidatus Bathyarchaeia archaeon]|nr:aspartyl-phosphate phosphatase Spo0E family protein [Candidatus Bathyarchaeia archaeon]
MDKESILQEIEKLRGELNELYKEHSAITPEVLALSVRLDQLLNKWHHSHTNVG